MITSMASARRTRHISCCHVSLYISEHLFCLSCTAVRLCTRLSSASNLQCIASMQDPVDNRCILFAHLRMSCTQLISKTDRLTRNRSSRSYSSSVQKVPVLWGPRGCTRGRLSRQLRGSLCPHLFSCTSAKCQKTILRAGNYVGLGFGQRMTSSKD